MDNWISFVLIKVIFVIIIMAISVINDHYLYVRHTFRQHLIPIVSPKGTKVKQHFAFFFFMVQLLQILLESHVNPLNID